MSYTNYNSKGNRFFNKKVKKFYPFYTVFYPKA